MKKSSTAVIIVAIIVVAAVAVLALRSGLFGLFGWELSINSGNNLSKSMQISSPAFQNNSQMPSQYTCDGLDINPPLAISGVPAEAMSLALVVDDPDAPSGTWDHWIVWNIPPSTAEIAEGAGVPGVKGKGSGGESDYAGPCPPSGTHRYIFKLYALDELLHLDAGSSKAQLEKAMKGHILDKTEFIGLYKRK